MMHPQRLVSLWDMLSIHAATFVDSISHMGRLRGVLELGKTDRPIGDAGVKGVKSYAELLEPDLIQIGAPAALASIKELYNLCEDENNQVSLFAEPVKQVTERFKAELAAKNLYILNHDDEKLFSQSENIFSADVSEKFSSSTEDISEAAKCLALSRYTASVFHLMRTMESAVQVLSSYIGIDNTEQEWGKLLSDISSKIEDMPKGDDRNRWSESHSHLYHVKQAWRNSTMHPKKTYTEEEAKSVFDAVGSFMNHLCLLVPGAS